MSYKCLLFDLDGTLVDSRADLANSVNLMLAELGREVLPSLRVLNFVGEGARLLVERALTASAELPPLPDEVDGALEIFQRHYREHLLDQTRVYPEVEETLAAFRHFRKPSSPTTLRFHHGAAGWHRFAAAFQMVLGGDSLPERKPSPMMLRSGAGLGVQPSACLMMAIRSSMLLGGAAGMKTCGYIQAFGRTEWRKPERIFNRTIQRIVCV